MLAIKNSAAKPLFQWVPLIALLVLTACSQPGPSALLEGERLLNERNFAAAVEKLKTATELLPENAQAWNHLGLAQHGAGNPEEAERAYLAAINLDDNLAAVRFNLGSLYLEQDRADEAVRELTSFAVLRPSSLEGRIRLGSAEIRSGQWEPAARSFTQAYGVNPEHPEILNGLGMIQLHRNNVQEAGQFFNAAIAKSPGFAPPLLNLAILTHRHGRDKSVALKIYRDYLALEPRPKNWALVENAVTQLAMQLNPPPVSETPPPVIPAPATNRVTQTETTSATEIPPTQPAPRTNAAPVALLDITGRTERASSATSTTNATLADATSAPDSTSAGELELKPISERATTRPNPAPAPAPPVAPVKPAMESTEQEPEPTPEPEKPTVPEAETKPETAKPETPSKPAPKPVEKPTEAAPVPPVAPEKENDMPIEVAVARPETTAEAKPPVPAPTPRVTPKPPARPVAKPPVVSVAHLLPPRDPKAKAYRYINPPTPRSGNAAAALQIFAQGVAAHEAQRMDEAIRHYEQAAQINPSHFEVHYNLGFANYGKGNFSTALAHYERALAVQPKAASARFNFALTLQRLGYDWDAAHEFEKLLTHHPDLVPGHLALANHYAQELKDVARAREHYRRVLQLEPRHKQAQVIRYWLAQNQ